MPGRAALLLSLALLFAAACDVPVASDLDEQQATRVVVALQQTGVAAEKQPVNATGDRYRVTVPRTDAPSALQAMVEQRLLNIGAEDPQQHLADDTLVMSRAVEQARLSAVLATRIENSLLGLQEVLSARVHLALPPQPSTGGEPPLPQASVLLRFRNQQAPLNEDQIKALVTGAVPGLTAEQVSVVMLGPPHDALAVAPPLSHLGPITITQGSAPVVKGFVLGLVSLNLLLLAALGWMWRKAHRLPPLGRHDSTDPGEPR